MSPSKGGADDRHQENQVSLGAGHACFSRDGFLKAMKRLIDRVFPTDQGLIEGKS